jgi:hypothetical protein
MPFKSYYTFQLVVVLTGGRCAAQGSEHKPVVGIQGGFGESRERRRLAHKKPAAAAIGARPD